MDDGDALGRVRMRIAFGRLAVGGPARVPDPGMTRQRLAAQPRFEILQLAFGPTSRQPIALERRNACGIVAAIFKALQRIDELFCDRAAPENADNAAHADRYLPKSSKRTLK